MNLSTFLDYRKDGITSCTLKESDRSTDSEIKIYRPVALTSILCKTYEKMDMKRLQHLESHKINNFNKCNFKAAHDLVSRNVLLHKLSKMNTPNIFYAIHDFLCQGFISFRYKDVIIQRSKKRFPRGAVSSTTLFNCTCVIFYAPSQRLMSCCLLTIAIIVSGDNMQTIESIMNCTLEELNECT